MFNCIINFFKTNNKKSHVFDEQYRKGYKKSHVFDEQYRKGYNKLWINSLKNYYP
jgi:hypothetical protein